MKFIFLTILATIIVFFVWNILRRIFSSGMGSKRQETFSRTKKPEGKINQKFNWDAETVGYEEVKEEKTKESKN